MAKRRSRKPSSPPAEVAGHSHRHALPGAWAWTTVGEVGHVRVGLTRSPERRRGRFPTKYLRAANVTRDGFDLSDVATMDITPAELETYSALPSDILLVEGSGSAAMLGRSALWAGQISPCSFQNSLIRFRGTAAIPRFAMVVFRYFARAGLFASTGRGVGIQHLGGARFATMPFPLPPREEQERIVVDAERRLRLAQEAEEALQSALARMKEQVSLTLEAAATGLSLRPHRERGVATESPASAAQSSNDNRSTARPSPPGDSRRLPKGWRLVSVQDVGEIKLGRQRSPKYQRGPHQRPYLRVANVFEDRIDATDLLRMNFSPAEQQIYRLLPGDILLNEGQSPELVGRPAMYAGVPANVCFQNHLIRFRAGHALNSQFALLVFRHYFRSGQFRAIARWSTNIANLGVARFAALPFPLPPQEEQDYIVEDTRRKLNSLGEQQAAADTSLERIEQMRLEILAAAVSGRLVPQLPEDEPAAELLRRVGPPLEATSPRDRRRTQEASNMDGQSREPSARRPILDALRDLGGKAAPEELFAAAGFDRDLPDDVEAFYLELREALSRRIVRVSGTADEARLEASDAP